MANTRLNIPEYTHAPQQTIENGQLRSPRVSSRSGSSNCSGLASPSRPSHTATTPKYRVRNTFIEFMEERDVAPLIGDSVPPSFLSGRRAGSADARQTRHSAEPLPRELPRVMLPSQKGTDGDGSIVVHANPEVEFESESAQDLALEEHQETPEGTPRLYHASPWDSEESSEQGAWYSAHAFADALDGSAIWWQFAAADQAGCLTQGSAGVDAFVPAVPPGDWQYHSDTDTHDAFSMEPWMKQAFESMNGTQDMESMDPKMTAALYAGFNAGIAAGMSLAKSSEYEDASRFGIRAGRQRIPSDSETTGLGSDSSAFGGGRSPQMRQGRVARDQRHSPRAAPKFELQPAAAPRAPAVGRPASGDDCASAVVTAGAGRAMPTESSAIRQCQVIWCDQRSFKEASSEMREQLEAACRAPVSAHKSAEKCIRLLKKLQAQARPPCVFLISWANAPMLLPFLCECPQVAIKVILLTDMCRSSRQDAAEKLSCLYPFIARVAATWPEAVDAVADAVKEYHMAS